MENSGFNLSQNPDEFFKKRKVKRRLNAILESCSDTVAQTILREISLCDLVIVMKDLSEKAIKKVLQNVSRRSAKYITKSYLDLANMIIGESYTMAAQNRILEKITKLKGKGKIT